jgi:F-type H+-transporting ATPase subunit b
MDVSISAVIAQAINFGIMFWLFSKFAAKPLAKAIEERRSLIHKLENAEDSYAEKIQEANKEAEKIIREGLKKKETIIHEAQELAKQKQEKIEEQARIQAKKIAENAERQAKVLHDDLEKNFESSIKKTSLLVIKKLLDSDKDIQSAYIEKAIKDIK